MKIFYDFDGVIRFTLQPLFGREKKHWQEPPDCWKNMKNYSTKTLIEFYISNPEYQYYAPPTKYLKTILRLRDKGIPIQIVSNQVSKWREPTCTWISHYIGGTWDIHFTDDFEKKFDYMKSDSKGLYKIVEDYPNFDSYKNIILIDKPYNQCVKNPYKRIKTCKELYDTILKEVGNPDR